MCLFKRGSYKIAKEDLITYKVVTKELRSQYYQFPYEVDKLYSKNWDDDFLAFCKNRETIGGNGFHSNLNKDTCTRLYGDIIVENTDEKLKGQLSDNQLLVKCIIPKDSIYFEGMYTEIFSNQIIIKEICL